MHVLHCLSHSEPGGAQRVVFNLVTALRRMPVDVRQSVILPAGGEYVRRFSEAGIAVTTLPTDSISPAGIGRMRRLTGQEVPDVIHSHGKGGGLYSRFAMARSRVHSYHGFHPPANPLARILYLRHERSVASLCDALVCVSHSEEREVYAAISPAAGKTAVIPNIVDRDELRESAKKPLPVELASFLGNRGEAFVVTMVAREDPVKNHPLALSAAAICLGRDPRLKFVFAGMGSSHAEIRRLQGEYPGRIFASDAISEIPSLIGNSDGLLLTSRKEGGPLVVIEAFALGIPVVGTRVPGISDYVNDGKDGLLCETSPGAVADAIGRLAAEPGLRDRLAAGASERGRQLDPVRWASEYFTLYTRLVNAGR
jgi:glycosyltransferase involved in cell wall biosynthesis